MASEFVTKRQRLNNNVPTAQPTPAAYDDGDEDYALAEDWSHMPRNSLPTLEDLSDPSLALAKPDSV
ncbi:hypothetical protein IWQ61_008826, partial [Dispira simplex]